MDHIITAAQARLVKASLSSGAMKDLAKVFAELEDLCGAPYFKYVHPIPVNGEYPYYLEHKSEESMSDELEALMAALRVAGWHPIKGKEHRGIGWDRHAYQKGDRFLKLSVCKRLGIMPDNHGRIIISAIRLVPVHDDHIWDMANDIEED